MSKPPPPKEWQPSQAERIANGILDYCPTGAAVNFPFLQQPLHYWPLPQAHVLNNPFHLCQGMSLSLPLQQQNHPLMKQALPTPLPVSFSNSNDAVHETKNDCQNGNDLDIDAMDETNDNVSNAKDTTAATHEDTETLRVGQVFEFAASPGISCTPFLS